MFLENHLFSVFTKQKTGKLFLAIPAKHSSTLATDLTDFHGEFEAYLSSIAYWEPVEHNPVKKLPNNGGIGNSGDGDEFSGELITSIFRVSSLCLAAYRALR